jgi:hypothetical protein
MHTVNCADYDDQPTKFPPNQPNTSYSLFSEIYWGEFGWSQRVKLSLETPARTLLEFLLIVSM